MIGVLCVTIGIMGTFIHFAIRDVVIELRYRNTLLEKQNEILSNQNK